MTSYHHSTTQTPGTNLKGKFPGSPNAARFLRISLHHPCAAATFWGTVTLLYVNITMHGLLNSSSYLPYLHTSSRCHPDPLSETHIPTIPPYPPIPWGDLAAYRDGQTYLTLIRVKPEDNIIDLILKFHEILKKH